MTTIKKVLAAAIAVVALHVVLRVLGCAEHTGVLAGMARSQASYVLGPLYVLTHLFSVIAAPILVVAAVAELALGDRAKP